MVSVDGDVVRHLRDIERSTYQHSSSDVDFLRIMFDAMINVSENMDEVIQYLDKYPIVSTDLRKPMRDIVATLTKSTECLTVEKLYGEIQFVFCTNTRLNCLKLSLWYRMVL